jgi:hypothetical protein
MSCYFYNHWRSTKRRKVGWIVEREREKKSKVGWGPPKLAPITTSFGGVSFLGGVTTN